jgi:hypothetical protein
MRFSEAAREAIADGAARSHAVGFATLLRTAGEALRAVADDGLSASLANRLDEVASGVAALATPDERARPQEPPPAPVARPQVEPEIVDIAELAYDGEPVIAPTPAPVPARAPMPALTPEVVPIGALEPDGRLPLETGFSRYHALVGAGAPDAETTEAPAPADDATDVIDITSLCYRGRAARARAAEVGAELSRHFEGSLALDLVEPLLQELLDLVPLALDAAD